MLGQTYAEDGQYQQAIMELQQYRETCDPQERKGIQPGSIRSSSTPGAAPVPGTKKPPRRRRPRRPLPRRSRRTRPPRPRPRSAGPRTPGEERAKVSAAATNEFMHGVELFGDQKYDDAPRQLPQNAFAGARACRRLLLRGAYPLPQRPERTGHILILKKPSITRCGASTPIFTSGKYPEAQRNFTKRQSPRLTLFAGKTLSDSARSEAQELIDAYKKALGGQSLGRRLVKDRTRAFDLGQG